MGATAVKISAEFAEIVREKAAIANRSMAGQLEHLARMGLEMESELSGRTVEMLKRDGIRGMSDSEARAEVHQILQRLRDELPDAGLAAELRQHSKNSGIPLYEGDPKNPGGVIRINPDGTKSRGKVEDGKFVQLTGV
jgi:hypothetical protein